MSKCACWNSCGLTLYCRVITEIIALVLQGQTEISMRNFT